MFRKTKSDSPAPNKPAKARETIPTIITKELHVLGNMVSDGAVDFAGTIDGNIRCDSLTLRESGTVRGEITATTVHIHGTVKGLIRAKNVHLHASCHVEGIIMHEQLTIEDGAFVDGKFKRTDRVTSSDENTSTDNASSGFEGNDSSTMVGFRALENIRLIR